MKNVFRTQISDYDCVPTTFVNAISYLFKRSEIPPLVVQQIYSYCLNSVSARGKIGRGTSSLAVQLLGEWLDSYKEGKFNVSTEFLECEEVHFSPRNRISRAVRDGSVALLRVAKKDRFAHYLLLFSIDGEWLKFFDPNPYGKRSLDGKYHYHNTPGDFSNLRILRNWIASTRGRENLVLGPKGERECLIINRHAA